MQRSVGSMFQAGLYSLLIEMVTKRTKMKVSFICDCPSLVYTSKIDTLEDYNFS